MQRQQLSPDIEIKYDQLLAHMVEKNNIVEQFLRILREICDAEIFYSRSLDKFANNISKLIVGKDPLKDVFIIFERAIAAKSQQSLQLANNIKDDMIPFLERSVIDQNLQDQLRNKQPAVKSIRSQVQHKLRKLRFAEGNYKRICDQLKKMGPAQSRADMEERQKMHKRVTQLEGNLTQAITSYNHTIQQYLLAYTGICEHLSDIETKRKGQVRDGINKFMIFEISCIKNIEYNIPRYMKSLEKMNDRLLIQDKIVVNQPNSLAFNLAKINIPNYLNHIQDKQFQVPSSHKAILELKKNTPNVLNSTQYHTVVAQLYPILNNAARNYDIRVLKEIVYFSLNIRTLLGSKNGEIPQNPQPDGPSSTGSLPDQGPRLFLLDAVMCHPIFENSSFWTKYQQKLFDIINKEKRSISIGSQSKDVQISLSFLAGDIQFLKLISYHSLPASILAKFSQGEEQFKAPSANQSGSPQLQEYLTRNKNLLQ